MTAAEIRGRKGNVRNPPRMREWDRASSPPTAETGHSIAVSRRTSAVVRGQVAGDGTAR